MGVRGLMSTCLEDVDACSDTYDLVQVAQQRKGLELIVDFNSFKHHILSKFWKGLSKNRGNDYLRILGGEYASLDEYVSELVKDLISLDIHLVFYIDAEKGSSNEGLEQKLDTWKERHGNDIKKMSQILDVLWWETEISKLSCDTNINPLLLDDQLMATLRSCGCEINQSPAGEADLLIIRAFRDRPKAFAILSNDSDFCVFMDNRLIPDPGIHTFKGSRLIPDELFDIGNDLQLAEPIKLPAKPRRLKVKVISTEKLENHTLLVEMSIVAGNDYTRPYMQKYIRHHTYVNDERKYKIDIKGRPCIQNFAVWIKEYRKADTHPYLAFRSRRHPGFRQAVIYSRNFYNLKGEPDKCPQKGDFSQVIEEKIRSGSGQYPSNIMSMYNNFYWYRMLLEDNRRGAPCAELSLTPLRAHLYRIVLPKEERLVNEHGRRPFNNLAIAWVETKDNVPAPPLDEIEPDKISDNLNTFHKIWSHQEKGTHVPTYTSTGATVNWFERYELKKGFICYILRYFLLLNWRQNLQVIKDEFLALFAMMMGRWDEKKYQAIVIRPTVRCVTIGNWMQDVYRHGYNMFGSVLHIRHEFPLPSELFSGSVWTAMYMACQDDTFQKAAREVSPQVLNQIRVEMNAVIRENRDMIRDIVQNVFPFDDELL
ncbi:hypothetical protein MAR_003945 [Mya arenaria]|uniref:Uncharacterized protein n=1 Tax=Mya arenaria TaxID=6604 RepID=A0ABY7EX14_MYAAR|nr:hypothetical protein MAR_003945 [Mya arenaria]